MSGHSNSPYTKCLACYITLINMYLITSPSYSWKIINDRASPSCLSMHPSSFFSCLFFIYPYFSSTTLCTSTSPPFQFQFFSSLNNFDTHVVFGTSLIIAFSFQSFFRALLSHFPFSIPSSSHLLAFYKLEIKFNSIKDAHTNSNETTSTKPTAHKLFCK